MLAFSFLHHFFQLSIQYLLITYCMSGIPDNVHKSPSSKSIPSADWTRKEFYQQDSATWAIDN